MAGVYIGIILLCRIVQALFGKRSSNEIKNITMLVGDNAFKNTVSSVLGLALIIVAGNGFKADLRTVLIATFSGLCLFVSGCCGTYALKSGTVSLNSMFGTAGMIIPIIAGAVLFNQPISIIQVAGLGLFFVSAYLLIGASKTVYSNFSYKTVLLLVGSMVSNGGTMLAQQMFTHYVTDGDISVFSFISFGVIAILAGIAYLIMSAKNKSDGCETKFPRALIICGIALALAVFVINQLATACTKLVSPVILFTFINGGGTIISTLVAAIVYNEKMSKKTVSGVLIGIISLIIIKTFQH